MENKPDDLIKRSDAIKEIESYMRYTFKEYGTMSPRYSAMYSEAMTFKRIIAKLPSADRQQGEWILHDDKYHIEKIYLCSNCENFEAWGESEKYNFCPNCGARMKGADHE